MFLAAERWLGALIALMVGIVLAIAWPSDGDVLGRTIRTLVAPIGALLAWLLAPRAAKPGLSSALLTATTFALLAVLIGAFAVAWAVAFEPSAETSPVGASLAVGLMGLVIFGLPMFAFTLPVTLLWVGLLRLSLHQLQEVRARRSVS